MRSPMRTFLLLVAGGTLSVACDDPTLRSDLDTEGPPEVTIVTVTSEAAGGAAPTFCSTDANAKVSRVVCPEDDNGSRAVTAVTDVTPANMQVRIVFSELLDPNIEVLEDRDGMNGVEGHIDTTLPVTVNCGADLTYDGYYDVTGSHLTSPSGPALVVDVPGLQAATGSACTVMVNSVVTDKDKNAVAGPGPYDFTLAPLHFNSFSIKDATTGVSVSDPIGILFNAPIDPASAVAGAVKLATAADPDIAVTIAGTANAFTVIPATGAWLPETTYTLTFMASADVKDATGGGVYTAPSSDAVLTFTTGMAPPAAN